MGTSQMCEGNRYMTMPPPGFVPGTCFWSGVSLFVIQPVAGAVAVVVYYFCYFLYFGWWDVLQLCMDKEDRVSLNDN